MDDKARQYALKLLTYRGRSVRELREKLQKKGFPEHIVVSTIQTLKQKGFLDDIKLADDLKREALSTRFLSQYGARRFMLARGIPREIVDTVVMPDEEEDLLNAQRVVERKLRIMKNVPVEKIKKRIYNFLLRRGYSYETIGSVFKERNLKEE